MLENAVETLQSLREGLRAKSQGLNLDEERKNLAELEAQSNAPDLWNDATGAQDLMKRLSQSRQKVAPFDDIQKRSADLLEIIELAQMEGDENLARDIERDVATPARAGRKRKIGRKCWCALICAGRSAAISL
jgi:peptide chain release factor 2